MSNKYNEISSKKQLLDVRKSLVKELEQREEDFLIATSHELKTPLTSQKAFIQVLQREMKKSGDTKYSHYISKISEQTEKLMKLVSDLLDTSKIHGGKLALNIIPFDLNQCVLSSVEEIQSITAKHKIQVDGKITQNIEGDREKISQVIINLLSNAIKYSPNSNKINVTLKQEESKAHVLVQDFGIGIDEKYKNKIYERFFRVGETDEKTYPGLGVGLYIASEIAKQHNGKIEVDSVKGHGSTFNFSIPLK